MQLRHASVALLLLLFALSLITFIASVKYAAWAATSITAAGSAVYVHLFHVLPRRITDGSTQTSNLLLWDRTPPLVHSNNAPDCMPPPVTIPAGRLPPHSRWNRVLRLACTSQHLDDVRTLQRPARSRQDNYHTTMVPSILLPESWWEPVERAHNIQDCIGMDYGGCISCDGSSNISRCTANAEREKSRRVS